MKKRLHFWLMTLALFLAAQTGHVAYAQNPQTIEVGPHFGATSYIGELNAWRGLDQWEWKKFNQFDYELGGVVRYNYDSRWAFRLDYTYGRLRACDTAAAWRPEAMLNFRSTLHDLSLMVEFNFLKYYTGRPETAISPYIFAGVSGFMFSSRPYTTDTLLAPIFDTLRFGDLRTEKLSYSKYSLSIPFGVGCKFSLSKHLSATVEWRMHYTFTDYLDDVSGVYPADGKHVLLVPQKDGDGNIPYSQGYPKGYEVIVANPSETNRTVTYDFTDPSGQFHEGQQRGTATTNDWFGMINLSLTWKFVIPGNSACKMNFE